MASVASTNLFGLLSDDDTGDAVGRTETSPLAKEKKQAKGKKAAAATTAASTPAAASRTKTTETRVKRDYPARGGRTTISTTRPAAEGRDYEPDSRQDRPQRGGRGHRGHGHGSRGGRGREFDRHSATGRVDSEKKISQGWGPVTTNIDEADRSGDEAKKVDTEGEVVEQTVEEDQGPAVKTLDEYLAERAERLRVANLPERRKANEGTDESKWKNTKQLEKGDDDSIFFAGKNVNKNKGKKSGRGKVYVDIEQRFEEAPRRGGRGGYRGGRGGRGGDRYGSQVNVDDQSAFPTLGA